MQKTRNANTREWVPSNATVAEEWDMEALGIHHAEAVALFATTIILVVFFLIARVAHARQPVALAFAMMPLLVTWALQGIAASSVV